MENKKIVVFGSYVTDLTGRTPKFPTEGETVMGVSFKSGPGGKGSNQAVAAKRAERNHCNYRCLRRVQARGGSGA